MIDESRVNPDLFISPESPKSILCKCWSDAVQEAALDLHSFSTIPFPIERRGSQVAGSKGIGLINYHHSGTKQCSVDGWGKIMVLVEQQR